MPVLSQAAIEECKRSFIDERVAMIMECGRIEEQEADTMAHDCWIRYRMHHKLFINQQEKLIWPSKLKTLRGWNVNAGKNPP